MVGTHRRLGTWIDGIDRYIALSQFAKTKFVEAGFPGNKIVVKPNFVPTDPGIRADAGDYGLYIGRLSPEKGPFVLLQAASLLQTNCKIRFVGDGPELPLLKTISSQKNLANVEFFGWCQGDQVLQHLKRARFLVVPSTCYENFPLTIAEAFACGVPVICSRIGSLPEIVTDHKTGLLFKTGDVENLASRIDWAYSHQREMMSMGNAARGEYEGRFTAEANYRQLMGIYSAAMRDQAKNN